LFQIVATADGRVVGALTDGDVRRGLLRNVGLDEPVTRIMNARPTVAAEADYERFLARLPDLAGFLPLVDAQGRLKAVLVRGAEGGGLDTALILAGGRGRRLGERTQSRPKPMIEVADRPILEHVLAAAERAGVARIFVAVHYLGDQIADYLGARKGTASVEILREQRPLGTAGALGLLPEIGDSPLLVLNGDLITRVDLGAFGEFHRRNGFDATIGASEHTVQLPYGVIRYREDGTFLRIDEKPVLRNLVSGGIYALSAACRRLVAADEAVDMPDVLNRAESKGLAVGVFPIHEYWQDVGVPADLERAERHHRDGDAD
jgi:NDP-sugar pyrophosphorylase family protein